MLRNGVRLGGGVDISYVVSTTCLPKVDQPFITRTCCLCSPLAAHEVLDIGVGIWKRDAFERARESALQVLSDLGKDIFQSGEASDTRRCVATM